jgi:hypothetical protein
MTQNCGQANQGPELAKKEYYLEETLTIPHFFYKDDDYYKVILF